MESLDHAVDKLALDVAVICMPCHGKCTLLVHIIYQNSPMLKLLHELN